MLLTSVKDLDVDHACVRCPCNIGEISVISEIINLCIYGFSGSDVIDSQLHVFRIHSCHRVFDLFERTCTGGNVQKREGRYLALILAIECQLAAVRSPEDASVYAELVTADIFSVRDLVIFSFSDKPLGSVCIDQV